MLVWRYMQYFKKTSHTKYDCTYHIIWITKYRYPVLVGDIAVKARDLIRRICEENHTEIIRGTVAKDHIHVYVSAPPYISISKLVQTLKGKSSRIIQQTFPELRKRYWGSHFWAIGYFAKTVGTVSDEMIKEYLENHDKDEKFGNFQIEQ